jgi:hypothetical protein
MNPLQDKSALSEGYLHRVLVALDQFGNVVFGGDPDETISARSARAAARGDKLGKFMIWWLDKLQPGHGTLAESGDLARAQQIEEIERKALGGK